MGKPLAIAGGLLTLAAMPVVFPVHAASGPGLPPGPGPAKPAPAAFNLACRAGDVPDSRRDPAWVRQSFLGDDCRAPSPPAVPDGARASREQVVAGMAAVKRYAAEANAFQNCIGDFVAARQAAARLSPSQRIIENHRILASQKAVQAAVGRMQVAINAFNEYGSDCGM